MEVRESLTEGEIVVEKVTVDDDVRLYEAVMQSLPELINWTDWAVPEYSLSESREWLELGELAWEDAAEYHYSILDRKRKTYLGGCGIKSIDFQNLVCEIGYWVRADRAQEGIATTAAGLCCRVAFSELGMERVELLIHKENNASMKVAEKIGAKREAVLRKRIRLHGHQYDAYMYSILKDDMF